MQKIITVMALSLLVSSPAMAAKKRVSCKSFKTQKEAQQWYDQRKRSGRNGWKALDRDKDGEPCECLPGGSAHGSGKCR